MAGGLIRGSEPDTAAETVFRARRVVLPDGIRAADVVVRDGLIAAVEPYGSSTGALEPVGDDCVLLPGLVDAHVHVNEPGRTSWEGFATATTAAAAGGITTVVDMPLNAVPPTTTVAALLVKQQAARPQVRIDVAFWGGAVPDNLDDLEPLHAAGVVGFKCFLLPSGVDEFPPLDRAGLQAAAERIAGFGGLLIAHAEDQDVLDRSPAAGGRSFASFVASRPPEAEVAAVRNLLEVTRRTGCRTHLVHLSAAAALPLLRKAKQEGLPVTVETCPHYLFFAAEAVPDGDTTYKCCPPIRDAANRELLWEALADGTIDCIVSDHSPCTPELKRLDSGDFATAWGGIASVQLSLPAVWTSAAARGHDLSDVVRWMSTSTAALTGLGAPGAGKGSVAAGNDADLVVFAPDEQFVVDPATLAHRNPITAYAGTALRGVVRATWSRGVRVTGGAPAGRLLRRSGHG